jgi:hypothetical protein
MSWLDHHATSERLSAEAEVAILRGEVQRANELYRAAATAEEEALQSLDKSKARTVGITAVSAASLYYKAGDLRTAEALAHRFLSDTSLVPFAVDQLRGVLQSIWSEEVRQHSTVDFAAGEVIVSVSGGEIVEGGAPVDLILEKVQTVQALFYRTAEWMRGLPHRSRGRPSREIQDAFRPWLFQTVPGSYQFAVAVQEPAQGSLFQTDMPRPADLAAEFLRIVRASVEAPEEELPEVIPDAAYRSTILKLTRNLAPIGKKFSQLEIRGPTGRAVTLVPNTRTAVTGVIRATERGNELSGELQALRGVLRAVHLDKDWIEVTVYGRHVRITQVGEAVDDVIGPMVNHPVKVSVLRVKSGKFHFRDIESEEP